MLHKKCVHIIFLTNQKDLGSDFDSLGSYDVYEKIS